MTFYKTLNVYLLIHKTLFSSIYQSINYNSKDYMNKHIKYPRIIIFIKWLQFYKIILCHYNHYFGITNTQALQQNP